MISHQSQSKIHAYEHAWWVPAARITNEPITKLCVQNITSLSSLQRTWCELDTRTSWKFLKIAQDTGIFFTWCLSGNSGSWGISDPKYLELQICHETRNLTWQWTQWHACCNILETSLSRSSPSTVVLYGYWQITHSSLNTSVSFIVLH